MGMLDRIAHIVVLMLENRSFDNILGKLYPKSAGFDGLSGTETNFDRDRLPHQVWNAPPLTDRVTMTIPDPDPGELWTDINFQLSGRPDVPVPPDPDMSGFVINYLDQAAKTGLGYPPESIMHYFVPEQVPVISQLARQFAVSDRWFASAPCQTWPNRFFVHSGTADGHENNTPIHFPDVETIFNRLDAFNTPGGWKVYFHDIGQAKTLRRLWPRFSQFRRYAEFQHDAKMGTLPAYSFIEPRYFSDSDLPNDEHPPHVVTLGEQLIADVYNSLRNGPHWTSTLLVITYDEHGGCYDHVSPPAAQPPGPGPTAPFNFDRYGVRVPAVIVSPYVPQGTVLRPSGAVPFDHTSIIATLRARFALGAPLTDRDGSAPTLDLALTLANPDNLGPDHIEPLPFVASPADVAHAQAKPLNDMQRSLLTFAGYLPTAPVQGDIAAYLEDHLDDLSDQASALANAADQTVGSAISFIKQRLGNLFRSA
ncbi:MAG TPA: alkaline phosphatase family protein [Alphaproteobacteria bacterium]|nr:alkaline phosphatase family protein [Alphaproteobacteria bacterium]